MPKKSATFGLPGDRENIVMLNASHYDMCRFNESKQDQDNFKLVRSNIEDLYQHALLKRSNVSQGETPLSAPETNAVSTLKDLSLEPSKWAQLSETVEECWIEHVLRFLTKFTYYWNNR